VNVHASQQLVNDPAIDVSGLVRRYGDIVAVRGIDLAVARGEIHGFLGPNGAGKTTVVRILCTLLRPTEGEVRVAGFDVVRDAGRVRLRIGAALQEAALDPVQTGRELLELQARLFALPRAIARRRVGELAELVDLGDALDRRVKTYSGGMRRRLDLALALIHEPAILFLDEPTTGLDPASRRQVWNEVRRLNEERGVTIFLTTQYLEEADQLAHRLSVIAGGEIVAAGSPEELKRGIGRDVVVARVEGRVEAAQRAVAGLRDVGRVERSGSELTLAVTDGPAAVVGVATALAALDGLTVREISVRRPSLDDVFLHVTGERIRSDAEGTAGDDAGTENEGIAA
jgi:ABC-2 type transport system ATP-binding protein